MSIFDVPPISDKLTLERLRLGSRYEIPAYIASTLRIEQQQDIFDRMVYKLSAEVLAEKLPPAEVTETGTAEMPFPASPFQHWKQKHSTSWWLKRFVSWRPVCFEVHRRQVTMTASFDRYRTFPECKYQFPDDLGGYVNVAIPRPLIWEGM